jgi:hypothetical protein
MMSLEPLKLQAPVGGAEYKVDFSELGRPPAYTGKAALTIGPKERRVLVLPEVEVGVGPRSPRLGGPPVNRYFADESLSGRGLTRRPPPAYTLFQNQLTSGLRAACAQNCMTPKSVQVMIRAQYGIWNEEPAKTNGEHLQAASPGKVPGQAGIGRRIYRGD